MSKSESPKEQLTQPVGKPAVDQGDTFGEILGAAFWLSARSEEHRPMPHGKVADAILFGIDSKQFRLWRNDGAPFAFVSWGMLDRAAEEKFRKGEWLTKEELTSGDQAWVIAIISPFMPAEMLLKDLRDNQFKGQSLLALI